MARTYAISLGLLYHSVGITDQTADPVKITEILSSFTNNSGNLWVIGIVTHEVNTGETRG